MTALLWGRLLILGLVMAAGAYALWAAITDHD